MALDGLVIHSLVDELSTKLVGGKVDKVHQPEDDEIVLLADIVGGSPLTTALNVLAEKGLMEKTTTIGGMNLPLALTSVLMKDTLQGDSFVQAVLSEATTALQEFKVVEDDEDDI